MLPELPEKRAGRLRMILSAILDFSLHPVS
jgi:hypothetical protein